MAETAPYGSWRSPITSERLVEGAIRLGSVVLDGPRTYLTEGRPREAGRSVVVRLDEGGAVDQNPAPLNARTRAHEYGGGAFTAHDGVVWLSHFLDNRLYRIDPGQTSRPITPVEDAAYAALNADARRGRIVCVREDHSGDGEPTEAIVSLDANGEAELITLAEGADFYASPRLSPDGRRLAWISWNHPNMPWDESELWVADLDAGGRATEARRIAGGSGVAVFQPEWGPGGQTLYFTSDESGYFNLYRYRSGRVETVCPMEAEFALPQWQFEMSTYAPLADGRLIAAHAVRGRWRLGLVDPEKKQITAITTPYTEFAQLRAAENRLVFAGASPTVAAELVEMDVDTGQRRVLRKFSPVSIDSGYLSEPRQIEFPSGKGTAFAWFYPPQNRDFVAPDGELPPLIVKSHGGPTAQASTGLNLRTQYWTSRGFGVVDVDYGGSTGYGREYRQRLDGSWGVVDVEDCIAAARYLVEAGLADGARLIITGGSAGGYTTLAALTFHDVFKAGASHYGVSDLEALARETHKFESRYLDRLVGPYPARRDLYVGRSPIHHVERLSCPVVFFQGLEDKVVPPSQAERMVAVLRDKGIPVAYVPFEGEQHGFRLAENIQRAVEGELYFYSRVFGFPLAESVEPVPIDGLAGS